MTSEKTLELPLKASGMKSKRNSKAEPAAGQSEADQPAAGQPATDQPVAGPGPDTPQAEFVCEELIPVTGSGDAAMMSHGEPGLPGRFTWRGVAYEVVGVIETWKTQGPCRHGSGEMYLRRHWYRIQVRPHRIMTVYCDRQAKNRRKPKSRWWVYTVEQ
jgi:phosphoribosylglycinamide formyltransferase-1